ncbi:MAG: class I adenylate-forming enzyme family protein [Dehalococcoidia bacterium]
MSINIGQLLDNNVWRYGEYKQLIYITNGSEQIFTNKHILGQARALATGLKIKAVKKGDIVASVLSNIPEIPEIINGVHRMGGVYLPIVFMLTAPEIRYILEDSRCKVIITEDTLLTKVLEAAEGTKTLQTIILIGEATGKDIVYYSELLKVSDERGNIVEVDDNDLAILMYTSGTTGYPKGVMLTHQNMYSQMKAGISVWGIDRCETLLTTVPMNTIYGVLSCLEGYHEGFSNILMPPFDPRKVLDTVRKYRASVLPVVPTMLNFMLVVWNPSIDDISSIDLLICSGAPLPLETLKKAQKTFGVEITQGYGCTEVGGSISRQRKDWPRKPGSTGFPISGMAVKIVDDNGNEVQRGQEGEIICKGPMVMKGYLNKPRETADALKNGWLYTGDIGKFDDDGELYVTGLKKDIIIKGGENIDPGISENWLYKHPAVADAAVFGIKDEKYGEEIAAAVVLKPGFQITEVELLEYLSGHIHHYMAPKKIFFMKAMPKTGIGKIRKNEIRRVINE